MSCTCPKCNGTLCTELKADDIMCDKCACDDSLVFRGCRKCNYDICERCAFDAFVKEGKATAASFNPSTTMEPTVVQYLMTVPRALGPLRSVPGIGEVFERRLHNQGIDTVHQLIGIFLRYRGVGVSQEQMCNAFFTWLRFQGASTHWAGTITWCLAERMDTMFKERTLLDMDLFCPERCVGAILPLPVRRVVAPKTGTMYNQDRSTLTPAVVALVIDKADTLCFGALGKCRPTDDDGKAKGLGFGKTTCDGLAKLGGTTTLAQLGGMLLQLKETGIDKHTHLNAFYRWLIAHGAAKGYCATITHAVSAWLEPKFEQLFKLPAGASSASK